mmetsp:Transcript_12347/g.14112  ORF Transcript_12347/g.14112 Transcript_12347/m.14112 type:complete len:127 (+) Transcript_12347:850-1230(+)
MIKKDFEEDHDGDVLMTDADEKCATVTATQPDADNISESAKIVIDSLKIATLQLAKMAIINDKLVSFKPSEIALASLMNAVSYLKDTGYLYKPSEETEAKKKAATLCGNNSDSPFSKDHKGHLESI